MQSHVIARSIVAGMTLTAMLALPAIGTARAAEALPAQVVAFTSDQFPITGAEALRDQGVEVHVFNLDQARNLERQINARLPGNQAQAEAVAKNMLGDYQAGFIAGWRGIVQAVKWQIHSLPAMVFDRGTAVLYGETDLQHATGRWQRWRATGE